MTAPSSAVTEAIACGPIDPTHALDPSDLDRLLDATPCTAETGWCNLPNGVGYAAVRTEMPGVTAEMIDWWFDWHPRAAIRYQLWFPGAHKSVSLDPATTPGAKAHWNAVHHLVEDIGLGTDHLRIAFLAPSRLGFSTDALDDQRVGTIIGGLVGDDRRHVQHTRMVHVFLNTPEGLEQRSRFWIGAALRPHLPAPIAGLAAPALNQRYLRRLVIPKQAARKMAEHCAAEYANLASLLPVLFAEYGDDRGR